MTLSYPSTNVSLTTHVGKEAFITALSDGNIQLEVMKWEPPTVEAALSHAIKVEAYEQFWHVKAPLPLNMTKAMPSAVLVMLFAVSGQSDSSGTATLQK